MATRSRRTTAVAEPAVPTVMVEWLVSTANASHEGGCNIGGRRYEGRAGQQVEIREDDAAILVANHFVRYAAQSEQPGEATPQDAPAAGFTKPTASSEQAQ